MSQHDDHQQGGTAARVLEVRTGRTGTVEHRGRSVPTAFRKAARTGPVAVATLGLEGDEQADPRVHGGPDKAVYAYPVEHYAWWQERLGVPLAPGFFGENLLLEGLTEDRVHLGDRYAVGELVLEVSMPRRPCFKLAAVHDRPELPELLQESGRTGFYLRVLAPGTVAAGDRLVAVGDPVTTVTVHELNRVMNLDRSDLAAAAELSAVPQVPERWRQSLARRLDGHQEPDGPRLRGT
ncbi:MOSC domain-containing protein [Nocardioides lijunqiniae]|uniref:MOSC domain-containing protein n=1 Tax=Nocardioides lijunqiniae TaxID=2760832 RepID=UPI001877C8A8|nr:MOSC domain-containing protein [Nocardioides lijunqiniae]